MITSHAQTLVDVTDTETYRRCEELIRKHGPVLMRIGEESKLRKWTPVTKRMRDSIARRIKRGDTFCDIAADMNLHPNTVSRIHKKQQENQHEK